jgi:tetratricopeptide (TPR) repeat protein
MAEVTHDPCAAPERSRADRTPEDLFFEGVALGKQGKLAEAVAAYRRALDLRPTFVEALHNLGEALGRLGQAEAAVTCFRRALEVQPNFPEAANNLGVVLMQLRRSEEAVATYHRALELRPDYSDALNNLGVALAEQRRLDEAVHCYQRAIAQRPDFVQAHSNLGLALREQMQLDASIASHRRAIALQPGGAMEHFNYSIALLTAGDMQAGFAEHEWRWQLPDLLPQRGFRQPQWHGEAAEGKTLLIHPEGGFGDVLQFCRYAPLAAERGLRVVIEAPKPLVRLLTTLTGVEQVAAAGDALPAFDVHCPVQSLALAFSTTLATIPGAAPYLHADPAQVAIWRTRLGEQAGFRVGLVWAGNPLSEKPEMAAMDRRRSIPPQILAPLFEVPGICFVSLQKSGPAAPAHVPMLQLMHLVDDFADTAALIANLDLVIAVDTAVAHLAAALGKPVWLLNRFDTCWRWLTDRRDSPWYPTLRIYRQASAGAWDGPIAEMAHDLATHVVLHHRQDEALFLQGIAYGKQGQHADAAACYRRALALRADFPEAHNNLGQALAEQGELEAAVGCFRTALAQQEAFPEAHSNLGITLGALGRGEEALACHRRAMELQPDNPDAHNSLGAVLAQNGAWAEAVESYQRALELRPGFVSAYYNLGVLWHEQRRLPEATDCFRQVIALQPDSAEAFNDLGCTLMAQRLLDEAIGHFRTALALKPDAPDTHFNLSLALSARGDLPEGRGGPPGETQASAKPNLWKTLLSKRRAPSAMAT